MKWVVYRGKHLTSFIKVYRYLKNGNMDGRQWHYHHSKKEWVKVGRVQVAGANLPYWTQPNKREMNFVKKQFAE